MASTGSMIAQEQGVAPSLDDVLKDLPLHQNFYLRGVFNAFLPAFMNPFEREINERSLSGEAIEALRLVVNDVAGDVPEGHATQVTYDEINKKYNLKNVFASGGFDMSAFENQIKMALGTFTVEKKNGKTIIHDKYDFPPVGEWEQYSNLTNASDYIAASNRDPSKAPYFVARFLGERYMAEGDEDNLSVNITLPEKEEVVDIDFDDNPPPKSQNFVFRGPMTNKRKSIWDKFTSMFVTEAEAASDEVTPPMPKPQQVSQSPSDFGKAFAQARSDGVDTFTFKGKEYTTELA